jgi:phenylalanine-4-hydroxylase
LEETVEQAVIQRTPYVSRQPDASGRVLYTEDENAIWAELYARQKLAIRGKACDEFVQGMDLLHLPEHRVPQLGEVSKALKRETGWEVAPVPALIPFLDFCALLADRKFPAASFVRRRDELNYLQEPDIFHEIFGHAPLLINPYFAGFTEAFGKLGLASSDEDRVFLERMYWFTVEFGLLKNTDGELRIYGGGILSSIGETEYAFRSELPQRRRFDLLEMLRTPYRIDIMQPLYYVLDDLRELYELAQRDVLGLIQEARRLGMHEPLFVPKTAA